MSGVRAAARRSAVEPFRPDRDQRSARSSAGSLHGLASGRSARPLHRSRDMASVLKAARARGFVDRLELEARERARGVLADAEERAARVRLEAEAEREAAMRGAVRSGREEGLATAAAALLAAGEARRRRLDDLEHEIAAAALDVARKLIGRAVAERPESVAELARRALQPVRARREVVLRVNPEDASLLRAEQPRLRDLLDRATAVEVRADPAIERGGVVVETEAGRVDARVEAQLAMLERALGDGAA